MSECVCGHSQRYHHQLEGNGCQFTFANYGGRCNCRKYEPQSGTACPICGQGFVHKHTSEEIAAHRCSQSNPLPESGK